MNEDLKRWDEEADNWDKQLKGENRVGKHILDAGFFELLNNVQGLEILDAGCGNGRFTKVLADKGANVLGIDGSPKMIDIASGNFPGLKFKVADINKSLGFGDQTFNVIISANVLMSLADIHEFLSESWRTLKNDGILLVSVLHPAFNEPTMRLYNPWWYKLLNKPVDGLAHDYFQKTNQRKDDYGNKPWPFYHRTLSNYAEAFRANKFFIDRISEPSDVPESVLKQNPTHYAKRLPRFIIFKLVKS